MQQIKLKKSILYIMIFVILLIFLLMIHTNQELYFIFYWTVLSLFTLFCIAKIKNNIINAFLVFSVFYTVLFFLGPYILYIQGFDYFSVVGNYFLFSFFFFTIGYFFANRYVNTKKIIFSIKPTRDYKTIFFISVILFCVSSLAYLLYFFKNWNYIYIDDFENGRVNAMTGNGLFLWIGSLIWLAIYMLYEQFLLNGYYKKTVILMFTTAAIFSVLLGFRSALVNPILILIFMKNKNEKIPIRIILSLTLILFVFVGAYGSVRAGNSSFLSSLIGELKVSSVNLKNILSDFPEKLDYQLGKTFVFDFLTLFNDDIEGTTSWLKSVLKLSFSGGGVTPTIMGEFYINFGNFGVMMGMFLLGIFFNFIEKSYQNPHNSIFLCCLILGYIRPILRGGIGNSLISILVYIIGYYCCQYFAKKINIRIKI